MHAPNLSITHRKVACSTCSLRESCLPLGLPLPDIERLERLVAPRASASRRGERLFRAGETFECLYAVRTGFLKSTAVSPDGHGAGHGVSHGRRARRPGRNQRRETTRAKRWPWRRGQRRLRHSCTPALKRSPARCLSCGNHFHKVMSRESVREHGAMLLLGDNERRRAVGRVPAQPFAALRGAPLLAHRVRAADDARGDRQSPRPETRNGRPHPVALRARRASGGSIRSTSGSWNPDGLRAIVSGQAPDRELRKRPTEELERGLTIKGLRQPVPGRHFEAARRGSPTRVRYRKENGVSQRLLCGQSSPLRTRRRPGRAHNGLDAPGRACSA